MCNEIIFLPNGIKEMLDENGIKLDMMTEAKRKDILPASVCYNILDASWSKKAKEIFSLYGIREDYSNVTPTSDNRFSLIDVKEEKPTNCRNIKLNAYCPNKDCIILWEEEVSESYTNDMFTYNLKQILKAMARAMSFEQVIKSQTFETLILRG